MFRFNSNNFKKSKVFSFQIKFEDSKNDFLFPKMKQNFKNMIFTKFIHLFFLPKNKI